MKKIITWLKAHKPSKRKLIQLYAALLFNANLKGFATGEIYKGSTKNICTPGLNCYSCPGALGSCPIGALQAVIGSRNFTFSFYIAGFLMLIGAIMGFLCLVVSVVANVLDSAVALREENDLTI